MGRSPAKSKPPTPNPNARKVANFQVAAQFQQTSLTCAHLSCESLLGQRRSPWRPGLHLTDPPAGGTVPRGSSRRGSYPGS